MDKRFLSRYWNNSFKYGFATKWLKSSRGVRQGVSTLPLYLFVLSAEILAAKIRQNNLIKGINLFVNLRCYIYSCKLQKKALTLSDFAKQIEFKYQLERLWLINCM